MKWNYKLSESRRKFYKILKKKSVLLQGISKTGFFQPFSVPFYLQTKNVSRFFDKCAFINLKTEMLPDEKKNYLEVFIFSFFLVMPQR